MTQKLSGTINHQLCMSIALQAQKSTAQHIIKPLDDRCVHIVFMSITLKKVLSVHFRVILLCGD